MKLFTLKNPKEIKTPYGKIPTYQSKDTLPNDLETLNHMLLHYKNDTKNFQPQILLDIAQKMMQLDNNEQYSEPYLVCSQIVDDKEMREFCYDKWQEIAIMNHEDLVSLAHIICDYLNKKDNKIDKLFYLVGERVLKDRKTHSPVGMCMYEAIKPIWTNEWTIMPYLFTMQEYMNYINTTFTDIYNSHTLMNKNTSSTRKEAINLIYTAAEKDDPFALAIIIDWLQNQSSLALLNKTDIKYWTAKYNIIMRNMQDRLLCINDKTLEQDFEIHNTLAKKFILDTKEKYYDYIAKRQKHVNQADQELLNILQQQEANNDYYYSIGDKETAITVLGSYIKQLELYKKTHTTLPALYYFAYGIHLRYPSRYVAGIQKCIDALEKAISLGYYDAYMILAQFHKNYFNIHDAYKYYIEAAKHGSLQAMIHICILLNDSNYYKHEGCLAYWLSAAASITNQTIEDVYNYLNDHQEDTLQQALTNCLTPKKRRIKIMKQNIYNKVVQIASEYLLAEPEEITLDFNFKEDILFDELNEAQILIDLEDEYCITFDNNYQLTTVEELVNYILEQY